MNCSSSNKKKFTCYANRFVNEKPDEKEINTENTKELKTAYEKLMAAREEQDKTLYKKIESK